VIKIYINDEDFKYLKWIFKKGIINYKVLQI